MIRIDKKVAKAALKLTKQYGDVIHYDGERFYVSVDGSRSVQIKVKKQDVIPSIERLCEKQWFENYIQTYGGINFSISPKLLHRHAFFWDDFTKLFWGGFATGLATGLATTLLAIYFRSALSQIIQWLLR